MLGKIKDAIQDRLYENCIQEYQRELRWHTDPYMLWVRDNEGIGQEGTGAQDHAPFCVMPIEQCGAELDLKKIGQEFILFVSADGRIADNAFREFERYFASHDGVDIVYADEDVWMLEKDAPAQETPKGAKRDQESLREEASAHRIFPWTKPMWSPDTLLSFLYFGNIFAVRRAAVEDLEWLGDDDYRKNIYDFVLKAVEHGKRPGHIEKILFHAHQRGDSRESLEAQLMHRMDLIGAGSAYDAIRKSAFARRGIRAQLVPDRATGLSYPVYDVEGSPLVTIVIPSKDNPEVLKQCIRSIYTHTDHPAFEIIVVDNGSAEMVRIGLEVFRRTCPFTYLYQPMDFNFSRMCNIGVKAAKGEYILLLNDDMEVIDGSWLDRMVGQAAQKHVGAVGAKLLYPGSTLIQHAGVTNTIYGPGHKLKQLDDSVPYYYGRNWFVYDMIGVTAACLLIRKEYYYALGGLYEGLPVAYNDVDLCLGLCERGLYNVQRNDVVLYHHESLSRGDDMQDEKKLERLMQEKDVLYDRHKKFYGRDPFIGTLMNDGEPSYQCRWLETYETHHIVDEVGKIRQGKRLPDEDAMNQTLFVWPEECGKETISGAVGYLVKGWAFAPGLDNARYSYVLLFCDAQGQVWELPAKKRYRRDVAAVLPDEKNVAMQGFCCWIPEGELSKGVYDLWLMAKDRCSRQRLYKSMERQLRVD